MAQDFRDVENTGGGYDRVHVNKRGQRGTFTLRGIVGGCWEVNIKGL